MTRTAAIIPALARNRFSIDGDLLSFGGVSLLEWKYNQLRKTKGVNRIYISSPDMIFKEIAQEWGVEFIHRTGGSGLEALVFESLKGVEEDQVLWAYPTSPFMGSQIFQEIIKTQENLDPSQYDGVITVLPRKEHFYYQGKPLNFPLTGHVERALLSPLIQIAHGASLGTKKTFQEAARPFSSRPYFFEVDALRALEIKDLQEFDMSVEFLTKYMRSTLGQ